MIFENLLISLKNQNISIMKCGGIFDKMSIQGSILQLQLKTTQPNFWDDNKSAQKILKKISSFENELKMWEELEEHYQEAESYLELLNDGEDVDEDAYVALNSFGNFIEKVQISKLLNERDDHRNAILTIPSLFLIKSSFLPRILQLCAKIISSVSKRLRVLGFPILCPTARFQARSNRLYLFSLADKKYVAIIFSSGDTS